MGRCHSVCALVLLATLLAGAPAHAQQLSLARQDVASHTGARGIAIADFNRDGWVDIALANNGRNTVTIVLNQRGAPRNFRPAYEVAVGRAPFDLTSGDFNGDGIPDLAVTNSLAHTVSILRGRAAGGFTRADIAAPLTPRGIATADINKDGRGDLVVTGWEANLVQVLFGNGAGGFTAGPTVSAPASHPQGVAAADFNRDGHLDLVVAHESAGGLAVLTGNGGTRFTATMIPGEVNLNVLAVGDFNRDGRPDVAAASSSGNRVAIFLGSSSGLRFARAYAAGSSPRDIVARDINHDGILDLVTANQSDNTATVLLGSASGSFQTGQAFSAGTGSRTVAAEDFDRDGRVDLAIGNHDAATTSVLWNETLFAKAAFSFRRTSFGTPSNSGGELSGGPADFNEDGRLDMVVKPDYTVGPVVHVILTGGAVVALQHPQYYGHSSVTDVNGDGHADVLVAQTSASLIVWPYLGNGRGGFARGPETTLPTNVWDLSTGDLDHDGNMDIVVVTYDPALSMYVLQLFMGAGDGSFELGSRVTTDDFTSAPRIADFNRDGRPDVAALVRGTLTVFHGDGAGGLQLGSAAALSFWYLQRLALSDVNHDGFLDAVVGEQGAVRVSLGSAGGFGAPTIIQFDWYSNYFETVVADIDLDGHPDIIGSPGFILRGVGDGTFAPVDRFDFDTPNLYVADFTRDGLPDIITFPSSGAFDVIVNRRNSINHAPTVSAGADRTFNYADQFADSPVSVVAEGLDSDLHTLAYEWRDQAGDVVSTERYVSVFGHMPGTYRFTVTARDGRGGVASDRVLVTIAPTKEIVLWSASGHHSGTFETIADPTAAGGERAHDRNLGRPRVNTPAETPANYVILSFVADPTQTYKLWIRLKADGNHWNNDSVWVQFQGAADAAGNPVFGVGTNSGLAVNLEECSGCGESGWGWEDDGWGAVNRNGVTLRFPEGGLQSMIVQTREDGVSFDQVVLSSERYLTTRPGLARNDATILRFTYWPVQD